MTLKGKTAFVTGAASGIGRESARAFARAGANVMAVDLEEEGLIETAALVRSAGGAVETAVVDVSDAGRVTAAIKATVERFGSLDCAHNNAGYFGSPGELVSFPETTARRMMDVNYWGAFYCMRAQIEIMLRQGGGTIVNTASGAGLVALPKFSPYCASKHALVGLTKSAAVEYAARGVRINCVCPGVVETKMVSDLLASDEARAALRALSPIGRFGQPAEIAEAVIWLSSPQSSFVVGATLPVDGGYTVP
jgi:NAD(P)-dependent dehydrogenase (short-subunit alcohol dehydrogenase family)